MRDVCLSRDIFFPPTAILCEGAYECVVLPCFSTVGDVRQRWQATGIIKSRHVSCVPAKTYFSSRSRKFAY